jgi:GxxExxY protein
VRPGLVGKKLPEPDKETDELIHEVIGAAIEVHRELGPGYLESVYHEALAVEFKLRNIPFVKKPGVRVEYKGVAVGDGELDFLVGGVLVVELKTVEELAPVHTAQVISYLKSSGRIVGLLINFHVPVLKEGIKRVIRS